MVRNLIQEPGQWRETEPWSLSASLMTADSGLSLFTAPFCCQEHKNLFQIKLSDVILLGFFSSWQAYVTSFYPRHKVNRKRAGGAPATEAFTWVVKGWG